MPTTWLYGPKSSNLWVIEAAENFLRQLAEEFPCKQGGLKRLCEVRSSLPRKKVILPNGPPCRPVILQRRKHRARDACNHPLSANYVRKVQFDELMQTLNRLWTD